MTASVVMQVPGCGKVDRKPLMKYKGAAPAIAVFNVCRDHREADVHGMRYCFLHRCMEEVATLNDDGDSIRMYHEGNMRHYCKRM